MTIETVLKEITSKLHYLDSPSLEARLLLAYVLNKPQTWLVSHQNTNLSTAEKSKYFTLAKNRQKKIPLAYLVRQKEFFGLKFYVDHRVLIPRPETEVLVEKAISKIDQLLQKDHPPADFYLADIGTGSGCIIISLAYYLQKNQQATGSKIKFHFYAIDISPEALIIAKKNAQRILGNRSKMIQLLTGNLLEPLPRPVDLLLANLPYLSEKEYQQATGEIKHEPEVALVGGVRGEELVNSFLSQAPHFLNPGGEVFYELYP